MPSRTTDHMVLFLFSIGITKGKWGTLLNTLLDFKADYDRNAPLAEVVPGVVAAAPERYAGHGAQGPRRRDVGPHAEEPPGPLAGAGLCHAADAGDDAATRFQLLMAGDAEKVPLDEMANRVVAVGVIPYPPGIPIVMPGENLGAPTALAHLPAHPAGVRPPLPRLREGGRGHRGARRRLPRVLPDGKIAARPAQQAETVGAGMSSMPQHADDTDPLPPAAEGGRAGIRKHP